MTAPEELLARHTPVLKYDSQESYFADSPAEWTDNPGNRLTRADGTLLATAGDGLSLAALGPTYGDGEAAAPDDVIGDPARAYREQARALHQAPGYANHVYGHAVADGAGDEWLQYWFFYFYNDYNLVGNVLKAGLHEGDWETVQIRLRREVPDRAVFAQHDGAQARGWSQVDLVPGTQRPIVYVARGSHASYFEPGTHWTGHWFDYADGKRRSPELTLDVVAEEEAAFSWVRWPGSWGDTSKTGKNPLDSDSPHGPAQHAQWSDPLALADTAAAQRAPTGARPSPPPPPRVRTGWKDGRLVVRYEALAAPGAKRPTALAVTVNSPDEAAPPTTEAFPIDAKTGTVTVSAAVDPSRRYDVYVSSATAEGLASESVRDDRPPAEPGEPVRRRSQSSG